jgi:hypothetical protein
MIDGLRRGAACDRMCSVRGFETKVERKLLDALGTRERKMAEVDEVPVGHAAIDGPEYWHIGAMTIRLANSRAPTRSGVNSALMPTSPYLSWNR